MTESAVFTPSGSVDAEVEELSAIVSWFPKEIGTFVYVYCVGLSYVEIDYESKGRQFLIDMLKDKEHRYKMRERFNLPSLRLLDPLLDQLVEKLEKLEEPAK